MRIANFNGQAFDVIYNREFVLRGVIFTRDGNQVVRFKRYDSNEVVREIVTPLHEQLGQIAIEKIALELVQGV